MEKYDETKSLRMKKHLALLRRVAGWSAEELGNRIGVKRQTISSIEKNPNYPLTKTQYIAIRAVFYCEIEEQGNQMLRDLIDLLIVNDNLSNETRDRIETTFAEVLQKNGRAVNSASIIAGLLAAIGTLGLGPMGMPAAIAATQISKIAKTCHQNKANRGNP